MRAVAVTPNTKATWPAQVASLITGRFAPEDAPRLLTAQRDADGIKNVVSFG